MSRTTTRVAALTGLTATTVATGPLLAPAASAAPAAPVVAPSTVQAGETFTVSGTDCPQGVPGNPNVVVVFIDDGSEYGLGGELRWIQDGKWSTDLAFEAGTKPGAYEVHAVCADYLGMYEVEGADFTTMIEYPVATVTLAGATTPVTTTPEAKPSGATTPEVKPSGAIRGPQANTAGVASPDGGSATGDSSSAGRKVVKVLTGFKPREVVTVTLHSTPQTMGTFTADANGTVTVEFTVPAGTPVGAHTLVYEGNQGTYFQEAFTVATASGTTASDDLAHTGADIALPLGLGAGALALGGGLVFAARRRSAEATQA